MKNIFNGGDKMIESWTGAIVSVLHTHRITQVELAREMGITAQYLSMVLNGKKNPKDIKRRMEDAIQNIIESRNT